MLRIECTSVRVALLATAAAIAIPMPVAAAGPADAEPEAGEAEPSALAHHALIERGLERTMEGELDAAMEVWKELRAEAPRHPAAPVFEASTLFWHQMFDNRDDRFDEALLNRCDEALAKAEVRLEADADDLEGHFYAGLALMSRGRVKGIRGHYYAAGVDGEKARKHLERAIEMRPDLVDARYQLGLYYYYASMVPGLVSRWLGWLWFIPTGNRDEGLAFLAEVAEEGDLFRWEAQYLLANIHLYHSPETVPKAYRALRSLHERFPDNTHVHFEYIESLVELGRFEDVVREARALEDSPRLGAADKLRKRLAVIWRARALLELSRVDEAEALLEPIAAWIPERPMWARPFVNLTHGMLHDARGERKLALERYEKVLAHREPFGSDRAATLARAWKEEPFAPAPELEPAIGG